MDKSEPAARARHGLGPRTSRSLRLSPVTPASNAAVLWMAPPLGATVIHRRYCMRRLGIAGSLVAGLAIGALVLSCSSDGSGNAQSDPIGPTGIGADPLAGNGPLNLNGGGWTPVVEAASHNKVTVCHSGNGSHFVQINVSAQGARAHLGDPSSGKGGHAGDYRVTDLTPCPPPATPGNVQVCKVAGVGLATGASFDFTVTANGSTKTVTVAAGPGPNGTCA